MWSGQDGFADYCSYCDQEPPSALHAPLHPARLASTLAAAAERLLAPVQHALLEATATRQASIGCASVTDATPGNRGCQRHVTLAAFHCFLDK